MQYDDEDLSSFDLDQGSGNFRSPDDAVEGQYRMKHTNEKFSLGGVRPSGGAAQQEESITQDGQDYPKALTEEE